MTKIILVRHGESLGNKNHRFLGHTDWDLSELGHMQAEKLSDYLEGYHIDVIYSSDLMRAYNTVKPVADKKGMEIIKNTKLREIYAGKWEGLSYTEIDEKYGEDYDVWHKDIGKAVCSGGESVEELYERVISEYIKIGRECKGKTVLVGAHATPIRMIKCYLSGCGAAGAKDIFWAPNASVTVVDYEESKILLDGYNDYLGELRTVPSTKM